MEKPQTWFASIDADTPNCQFYRCVFLLVYFCLLKIVANATIKATAMIVIPTNA